MSKEQLLFHLLQSDWAWTKSDRPGYVTLSKGDFSWLLSVDFTVYDLIDMLIRRGEPCE